MLKKMISRGQVEMMTGGYYEPILPIIPDHDKVGQIRSFSERIKDVLGVMPVGMWLAERVWEPHLPKHIKAAGVKYTVVDDSHFKSAGLCEEETFGYYVTEELGDAISIFPINEKMRYTIPFQPPEATIDYLAKVSSPDGNKVVVMADDGEKFGVWPDTYKHVFENKWLIHFLDALQQNSGWIKCKTFSDVIGQYNPVGRIYLPTASYTEMMEWVLPAKTIHHYDGFVKCLKDAGQYEANKIFVRGGFWRNYFAKYPESNQIHKKMLFVSSKINEALKDAKGKKQKELLESAKRFLWKGQVNCGYWHGVFGGLYLPHLRKAIYDNLAQADFLCEQARHKTGAWAEFHQFDLDVDGKDELIYQSNHQNLYFKTSEGGMLVEHDFLPRCVNLTDSLARREEAYHKKVSEAQLAPGEDDKSAASIHDFVRTKELGLEKFLKYDWHRRASLIDHFLGDGTSLYDFAAVRYGETGDFVNQPYQVSCKKKEGFCEAIFKRVGAVYQPDSVKSVSVEKHIVIPNNDAGFDVIYIIKNLSNERLRTHFGVEFNINFQAGTAPDRHYFGDGIKNENNLLNSIGEVWLPPQFGVVDEWQKIKATFSADKSGMFWRFPIETVSLSEAGFERVYQSSVIFPNWKIELKPGEAFEVKINFKVESI